MERASKGVAPIGADGKSVNLHHSKQNAKGPLFEISGGIHEKYGYTNALHPYKVDGTKVHPENPVAGIGRKKFDNVDKPNYWKDRAKAEKARRLNVHH
ncbi:hypothetical protein EG347_14690 [Chryseobacterium sp. G0186]|uniref:HNH/ENDO VII family nuclease n=1 Tax=Chryseobacterium sp. G0186 TaxID=2487064 RepID=UPI000F4D6084|nr:HNH/ENDO VII family nuclease [Chryseobacterium sp. G0186]AZA78666.1 hypothetical protein EG347_14690 [Chryseobacterium sp. G0186]